MPRYIDADALKAKYEQMLPEIGDGYHKETLQDVLFELEYAPTISPDDIRGVVHCGECKFWRRPPSCEGLARCETGETGIRYRTKNDFSDRRALEKAYTDWCDEHMVTEGHRDFGAFTFLHQKGWLNVRRIKSELGGVRSDDYFISPVRFREKMEDAFEETHGDPEAFHDAADNLMMKVLDQLGYGAGVAFFDEQEVWYA